MWRSKHQENLVISACVLLWLMTDKPCFSIGADTLSKGEYITESQTLISKGGIFELGFFKPGNDFSQNIYVGIWYKDFPNKTVVWVANRERPLSSVSGLKLKVVPNGNLGLYHDYDSFWSTSLMQTLPETVEAVLLDDGNLILRDGASPGTIFWQSFEHPTHTWLAGAKLGFNETTGKSQHLVSWKSMDDPSTGSFSLEMHPDSFSFFLQWNMSTEYWSSGPWNGFHFLSSFQLSYLANFSFVSNENETYMTYSLLNGDPIVLSMIVLDPSGNLKLLTARRDYPSLLWSTMFELPKNNIFGFCGGFGVFSESSLSPCRCLPGFTSLSSGCSRKSILQCEDSEGKNDGFLRISDIKFPANPIAHPAQSDRECSSACRLHCSCTAYAFNKNGCSVWEGALFNLQNFSNNEGSNEFLYLKLADSELPKKKNKIVEVIIAVVVPLVVVFSGGALGCFYNRRKKQKEGQEKGEDLLSFDFDHGVKQPSNDGIIMRKRNNTDYDLPMFSYESVSAATNNFSPENKLGEGGFGPVYKGKLLNGQDVALKRLSKKSGQGFEEFRNEILLIAKLQHRNLVRLLGCCIDPDESILIYEYMPNKSLDFLLFGSSNQEFLDWPTRIHIVEGIAQGLLYLHEYSRVRIIHRDLKASNILLDGEMSPKISDFGMARIFGGNDSRAQTNKVVGTFGYIAPEYALQGMFSIKSDVFSFGVLVLEVISGKRNTGFYQTDCLNLLGHAWELWNSERGLEVVDDKVRSLAASTALRYINVGLLCVQENPNERPTMASVVSMLSSEIPAAALPPPKKPAFTAASLLDANNSVNGLTVSIIEPR